MNRSAAPPITITRQPLPPGARAGLQPRWDDLAARSDHTFFLSWGWIGPWLATLPATVDVELVQARADDRLVGLALVGSTRVRRHGVVTARVAGLHATGRPDLDLLAVEHNGFLVDRSAAEPVRAAMAAALADPSAGWDELVLPGCTPPLPPLEVDGLVVRRTELPSPYIDLDRARAAGGVVPLLSSNGRSQVRRAMRDYRTLGPLELEVVADPARARTVFAELVALHQASWTAKGAPGAFAGPGFRAFHDTLVAQEFERGTVQLCRVTAGEAVVGVLYNFVLGGRVMNYQSGFDYGLLEGQGKPGFVAHCLAAEWNATRGELVYEFLAGEEAYKQRLATDSLTMTWTVLQRRRPMLLAEHAARRARRRALDWRSARAARSGDPVVVSSP